MEGTIGQVMMFAGNFAPRSWAMCQGQLLPIANYTALFSVIGTTYGGDGRTTFGLPDMQGRTPIGMGNGPGLSPRNFGARGGDETVTLTQPEMPVHSHSGAIASAQANMPASSSNAGETDPTGHVPAIANFGDPRSPTVVNGYATSGNGTMAAAPVTGDVTIGNAGGGQAHNNMQPWQVLPFVICLEGMFPSRS